MPRPVPPHASALVPLLAVRPKPAQPQAAALLVELAARKGGACRRDRLLLVTVVDVEKAPVRMRSRHTPLEPDSPAGGAPAPFLGAADVRAIAARALAEAQGGRASERLRRELEAVDRSSSFTRNALVLFQDLLARLGVATFRPILVPRNQRPFWLRGPHPLEHRIINRTHSQRPSGNSSIPVARRGRRCRRRPARAPRTFGLRPCAGAL